MRLLGFYFLLFCVLASCVTENPIIEIETDMGIIAIELMVDKAPVTSANFIRYIDENRWHGATFYRTVTEKNQLNSEIRIQVVQGGLFVDHPAMGLPPIEHESTEVTGILHLDGVISMARYEPGTATFEFFICVGDQPSLDAGGLRNDDKFGFAAFGRVIKGMDVVKKIHQQPEKNQMLAPHILITDMKLIP